LTQQDKDNEKATVDAFTILFVIVIAAEVVGSMLTLGD